MQTEIQPNRGPTALITGPYGHPFHPILVTVPIGAWVASLVLDIGGQVSSSRASALGMGARWLIAIGIIGAVAAALVGLLDLITLPRGSTVFRIGLMHAGLNLVVVAGFVVDFIWRESISPRTPAGPIVLTAVCLAILGVSGSLGGTLAYRYGVRVADSLTQRAGYEKRV